MGTVLLVLVIVLVVAGLVYGVVALLTNEDPGLVPVEPDGRARPLPNTRSLTEFDLQTVRFDVGMRGYRMGQVDRVLRRTAYDIGYKDEMIAVLEAEVIALREGRVEDAELLRKAREAAASAAPTTVAPDPGRTGGAHRSDAARAGAESEFAPVEVEEVAESDLADEADLDGVDDVAFDEETFAATAPGKLNRAALQRPDDSSADPADGSPAVSADQSPDDSADHSPANGTPANGTSENGTSANGTEPAGDAADTPAERGARG